MSDPDAPAVSRGLLIALGAVVVVAVLWLLVLGPMLTGDDDPQVVVPPRATEPDEPVVLVPDLDPDDGALYPETTEVFAARDPFSQLVSDDRAGDGGGTGDTGGTGGTGGTAGTGGTGTGDGSGDGSDGGTGGDGSGHGSDGGDGSGGGAGGGSDDDSAQVGGTEVKLIDVYVEDGVERALVTVNGRSYDVAEGETFADRFRLLDLSGECGTFLFGDSRFVLCEGDEIRK